MKKETVGLSLLVCAATMAGCESNDDQPQAPPPTIALTPSQTPNCGQLSYPVVTDKRDKNGNIFAINLNRCVTIYDPRTVVAVGTMAINRPFTIVCEEYSPQASWRIVYPTDAGQWAVGTVQLDPGTAEQFHNEAYGDFAQCPPQDAPTAIPSPVPTR